MLRFSERRSRKSFVVPPSGENSRIYLIPPEGGTTKPLSSVGHYPEFLLPGGEGLGKQAKFGCQGCACEAGVGLESRTWDYQELAWGDLSDFSREAFKQAFV